MRIFVAGATGVLGVRLVPLLVQAGHEVAGLTRSRPELVEELGAEPVACDVFDAGSLRKSVASFRPDVVVHQLTDLPDDMDELPGYREANRRIRTEGTRNLIEAAAGSPLVAQSTAFPAATEEHEALVLDAGGVIIRYGYLYGPGTWYATREATPTPRVHVDEAAERTVGLLEAEPGSVHEVIEPEG